jgi:hypothetical protein
VSKCVLKECGREGKTACGSTQLCAGLEAGIEGAVHASRRKAAADGAMEFEDWEVNDDLWMEQATEGDTPPWEQRESEGEEPTQTPGVDTREEEEEGDPWMQCLADADNGFNLLNCLNMLWVVRHRWPRGSRFAFNLYRHESRLLIRGPVGSKPQALLSREGVTQGCPLGMLLYGVALLPLAEALDGSGGCARKDHRWATFPRLPSQRAFARDAQNQRQKPSWMRQGFLFSGAEAKGT